MNVNDVKSERPDGDMLELIFQKQRSLAEKYHQIEERQGVGYGLLAGNKFDLNDIRSQELLKNFAWRVTEEITEATACHPKHERDHLLEELADALHFITELCIVADITPEEIVAETEYPDICKDKLGTLCSVRIDLKPEPYRTIQQLGLAMNCLKQKPWKTTHILTDSAKFRKHVIFAYHELCKLFVEYRSNAGEVYDFYFRKSKVNEFRQRSGY